MRSKFLLGGLVVLLGACANEPSVTSSYGIKDGAPAPVVSICYNASNTTKDLLAALARENCPNPNSGLRVWEEDTLFNECPISKRVRVTFLCLDP